ncbi:DNA primase [Bosea sp. SSUT16]|uniref:DNA primase n=1 Tax=Bosea spartocytisi TaxID=2773451 RepID=A0A927E716_9HYPH|nr:DNA primase [Bosea spartocytisi]MBD3845958.1 DNA primase [Bosea spartocytisi]MCT4473142.1 DNA primase [Bosea spartocytisi]
MTARVPDDLFNDWVEKAKAVSVLNCALKFRFQPKGGGAKLATRAAGEIVGPCPRCGGVDRFSIKPSESAWYCRGAGQGGYDSISMARYLLRDAGFIEAVEELTGEPRPQAKPETSAERQAREALAAKRKADDEAAQAKQSQEQNEWREAERRRLHGLWREGRPAPGSLVEAYLRHRCIPGVPAGARLRFHPRMHLREPAGPGGKIIWTGPAMLAAIVRQDRFVGLHMTWLDPRFAAGTVPLETKGKLLITTDGELLDLPVKGADLIDVKRSRGSKQGGHLLLVPAPSGTPRRLVMGEGIETTLSVWASMVEAGEDMADTAFYSAIDLGNLGGKARTTVRHPTLRRIDKTGRSMPVNVAGPVPDTDEPHRAIAIPDSVDELLLLADGDSDRFTVECVIGRAAARWARPGRTVREAWPEEGGDFNDMRMRLVRERSAV